MALLIPLLAVKLLLFISLITVVQGCVHGEVLSPFFAVAADALDLPFALALGFDFVAIILLLLC
jgi:hypothetical protein